MSTKLYWVGQTFKYSPVKVVPYFRGVYKFLFLLYTNSYIYRPFGWNSI